jgi:hypothetical protein
LEVVLGELNQRIESCSGEFLLLHYLFTRFENRVINK